MSTTGVLLMTFGTAETLDDVPAYLSSVRGGRPVPDDLVAEMRRRFSVVGGSPLTGITRAQAAALQHELSTSMSGRDVDSSDEPSFQVEVGMRHSPPSIADGMERLVDAGAERIIGLVLSPQFSPIVMGGYLRAFDQAASKHPSLVVNMVEAWHEEPLFLDAVAERVREALAWIPEKERSEAPVLFTAHSLPLSVATDEPEYIGQLHETAHLVAERVGLPGERWRFAYQSAGHTAEEWLTPDIKDLFTELRAAGHQRVVVAPIQFLADHLEVLYDIDVAAREQADAVGIELLRTESLNTMPIFIAALASVVRAAAQSGMG